MKLTAKYLACAMGALMLTACAGSDSDSKATTPTAVPNAGTTTTTPAPSTGTTTPSTTPSPALAIPTLGAPSTPTHKVHTYSIDKTGKASFQEHDEIGKITIAGKVVDILPEGKKYDVLGELHVDSDASARHLRKPFSDRFADWRFGYAREGEDTVFFLSGNKPTAVKDMRTTGKAKYTGTLFRVGNPATETVIDPKVIGKGQPAKPKQRVDTIDNPYISADVDFDAKQILFQAPSINQVCLDEARCEKSGKVKDSGTFYYLATIDGNQFSGKTVNKGTTTYNDKGIIHGGFYDYADDKGATIGGVFNHTEYGQGAFVATDSDKIQ